MKRLVVSKVSGLRASMQESWQGRSGSQMNAVSGIIHKLPLDPRLPRRFVWASLAAYYVFAEATTWLVRGSLVFLNGGTTVLEVPWSCGTAPLVSPDLTRPVFMQRGPGPLPSLFFDEHNIDPTAYTDGLEIPCHAFDLEADCVYLNVDQVNIFGVTTTSFLTGIRILSTPL